MFKKVNDNRGAVSIFLLIVLIPMMIISSIFVDMSRVRLASSVATAAGDLTLNTALTNYDSVLKNMYGLFATSQNLDDMMVNLEEYYRKSIEAAGVAPADAESYVDQIMALFKTETGSDDILNLNLVQFEVEKPENSSLADAAMLKAQVVEFMKYRAPLSLGASFIDGISSMKNLDKQTELIEDKTAFYEKQQSLMEKLEAAWWDIEKYQYEKATEGFAAGEYIKDKATLLNTHKDNLLNTVIPETVKYLYYKDYLYDDASYILHRESDPANNVAEWWMFSRTSASLPTVYYITGDYTLNLDDIATAIGSVIYYDIELTALETVLLEYMKESANYHDTARTNPNIEAMIYNLAQYNKSSNYYKNSVNSFLGSIIKLENYKASKGNTIEEDAFDNYAVKKQGGKILVVDGKAQIRQITEEQPYDSANEMKLIDAMNQSEHLKRQENSFDFEYGGHFYYHSFFSEKEVKYYSAVKDIVQQKETLVNSKLSTLGTDALNYYNLINGKITDLTNAIAHLNDALTFIQGDYKTALDEWSASATNLSDDSMGQNDKSEIEELQKVVDKTKIEKLIERLTKAKTSLESVRTQIEAYKFFDTKFKDIPGGSTYTYIIGKLTTDLKNEINGVQVTDDTSYNTVIGKIKANVYSGNIVTDYSSDEKTDPNLQKSQTALFTWLYKNFYKAGRSYGTESSNKVSTGADDIEGTKTHLETNAKGNMTTDSDGNVVMGQTVAQDLLDNFATLTPYLPSTTHAVSGGTSMSPSGKPNTDIDTANNSTGLTGLLGTIIDSVANITTNFRDDIYIANYILTMFSYHTYEAELYVDNGGDSSTYSSFYEDPDGDGKYTAKENFKSYADMALSLTNNPINPNANMLYGSEVEYIIFGNKDSVEGNKQSAINTIFAIRFALNCVYAFTDAEINSITTSAATALFGVPPLTPLIPIAKIAMIIGFAIAETAYDISQLLVGESIALIKSNDTWVIKPSSAGKAIAGQLAKKAVNTAFDAGVDALNNALEMTDTELQALIDGSTGELENIMNSVCDSTIAKFQNYAYEAVTKVVDLCNSVNMQAMCDELGMTTEQKVQKVIEGLNAWLEGQGLPTDGPIYEAKKAAVDYLTNNSGQVINDIFSKINELPKRLDGETDEQFAQRLSTLENPLQKYLDGIKEQLNAKIKTLADTANSKLSSIKDGLMDKLQTAALEGAESLRSTINDQIGNVFGTTTGSVSAKNSVVGSILSWSYSDYLTLFLIIALLGDQPDVVLRMADIIELNMQHMNGEYAAITTTETVVTSRFFGLLKSKKEVTTTTANANAFKLSNSYCYLTIKATMEVKPLLMTMPIVNSGMGSQLDGVNWYTVNYEGTLGY